MFDVLSDDAYYSRPIALRHPIVFYEGHLPAFTFNTLIKRALGRPSIDLELERLFARGIDPHERTAAAGSDTSAGWPCRAHVLAFSNEVDRQVEEVLAREQLNRPGDPLLDRAEAVFSVLEHEAMHQETLMYMFHRLPLEQKHRPSDYEPATDGRPLHREWIHVPAGPAALGSERDASAFGWDNEFPAMAADVAAFDVERHDVTNEQFLEFVEADGYADPRWWTPEDWDWLQTERITYPTFWRRADGDWSWGGMFELLPLPPSWPVYVSLAEASAFAAWRNARLMTEAEFQRAAESASPGVCDFETWEPLPAGSRPEGASVWGIEDLIGNGWEWTRTRFAPFPGFKRSASYPEYSADFFDGEHFVMKGASPATARELVRPTFRNWFRRRYPYVYATFRCVRSADR